MRVRKNASADELAQTMFHEALHMMSWFVNKLGFSPTSNPDAPETKALRTASHEPLIRTVRVWLKQLAESVNSRRATGQPQLTDSDVQSTAEWLVGEVVVRGETEVFRLASAKQAAKRRPYVGSVIPGTPPNLEITPGMVDNYLFNLSKHFLPTDHAGLDGSDRQVMAKLADILDKYFLMSVKRRFSLTAYDTGLEPPLPDISPTLPSKSFIDKIQPAD